MPEITEGRSTFGFATDWKASKFDEWAMLGDGITKGAILSPTVGGTRHDEHCSHRRPSTPSEKEG